MKTTDVQTCELTQAKYYYAIARGRKKGVFKASAVREFNEHIRQLTDGYESNQHKRFNTLDEAFSFLKEHQLTAAGVYDKHLNRTDIFVFNVGPAPVRVERCPMDMSEQSVCGICTSCVGDEDLHPQCDICDGWYHLRCVNPDGAEVLEDDWVCTKCLDRVRGVNAGEHEAAATIEVHAQEDIEASIPDAVTHVLVPDDPKQLTTGEETVLLHDDPNQHVDFYIVEIERLKLEIQTRNSTITTLQEENRLLKRQLGEFQIKEGPDNVTTDASLSKELLCRLRRLEERQDAAEADNCRREAKWNQQLKMLTDTSDMLVNSLNKQVARGGRKEEINGGAVKGGLIDGSVNEEGGPVPSGVAVEGSVGKSKDGEEDKWLVARRKRGKRRGGPVKGRGTSFEVFTDSHGRELGSILKGADVNVKGGARMETVVEGVSNGGRICTVVMGGTNDTTDEGVRRGLNKLRGKMGKSKKLVIVGVPKRFDHPYPNIADMIKRKNDLIKAFCNIHGYVYLNIDDAKKSFFTRHGLHFNMFGKRWLAQKIQNTVSFLC